MAKPRNQSNPTKQKLKPGQNKQPQPQPQPHQQSWGVVRGLLLTCKHSNDSQTTSTKQQQGMKEPGNKSKKNNSSNNNNNNKNKSSKKMKCSGSLCSNTKVMHNQSHQVSPTTVLHKRRPSSSNNHHEASSRSMKVNEGVVVSTTTSSSSSSTSTSTSTSSSSSSFRGGGGGGGGMGFRRLSGCYECRMVVDPVLGFAIARDPSLRATICTCPHCGDIFMNAQNLELHQAVTHAVSELEADDTSKNIVEIIFQSSWLKKKHGTDNNNDDAAAAVAMPAACPKIDRILKVHNTQTTVANFESYRDAVKSRASPPPARRPNPRCVADGNELLRFHAATFGCSLGLNGSTALCGSIPHCRVCTIIKNGFRAAEGGILTTATSGRAHEGAGAGCGEEKRAMLVCRVIAGRVKRAAESGNSGNNMEEYDSVGGANHNVGVFSNLDELYVFNPRAILPCFVVVYSGF